MVPGRDSPGDSTAARPRRARAPPPRLRMGLSARRRADLNDVGPIRTVWKVKGGFRPGARRGGTGDMSRASDPTTARLRERAVRSSQTANERGRRRHPDLPEYGAYAAQAGSGVGGTIDPSCEPGPLAPRPPSTRPPVEDRRPRLEILRPATRRCPTMTSTTRPRCATPTSSTGPTQPPCTDRSLRSDPAPRCQANRVHGCVAITLSATLPEQLSRFRIAWRANAHAEDR